MIKHTSGDAFEFSPSGITDGATSVAMSIASPSSASVLTGDNSSGAWVISSSELVLQPGRYRYMITETVEAKRRTVERGELEVLADLGVAGVDPRSYSERMLDAIRALLEGNADELDVSELEHNGKSLKKFSPQSLVELESVFAGRVASERRADRLARGESSGRLVKARFRS